MLGCGILGMWNIGDVGCWRFGMLGMWDVRDVRYWECGDVEDVGCCTCGSFQMWDGRDAGYSGCRMFGMWDVRDVGCSRCRMLIYKMPRVCEGFLFWSALKNWLWQYVLFKYFTKTFLKEHIFIEVVVLQSSTFQMKLPHVRFSRYFQNNYF